MAISARENSAVRAAVRIPAWAWVGGIVVVSAFVYYVLGRRLAAPFILTDELIYSEAAKSFAAHGTLFVRDHSWVALAPVYPVLISPAWAIFTHIPDAYAAAKVINSVVMSLAAVPAYLLARRVLSQPLSLVAAGAQRGAPLDALHGGDDDRERVLSAVPGLRSGARAHARAADVSARAAPARSLGAHVLQPRAGCRPHPGDPDRAAARRPRAPDGLGGPQAVLAPVRPERARARSAGARPARARALDHRPLRPLQLRLQRGLPAGSRGQVVRLPRRRARPVHGRAAVRRAPAPHRPRPPAAEGDAGLRGGDDRARVLAAARGRGRRPDHDVVRQPRRGAEHVLRRSAARDRTARMDRAPPAAPAALGRGRGGGGGRVTDPPAAAVDAERQHRLGHARADSLVAAGHPDRERELDTGGPRSLLPGPGRGLPLLAVPAPLRPPRTPPRLLRGRDDVRRARVATLLGRHVQGDRKHTARLDRPRASVGSGRGHPQHEPRVADRHLGERVLQPFRRLGLLPRPADAERLARVAGARGGEWCRARAGARAGPVRALGHDRSPRRAEDRERRRPRPVPGPGRAATSLVHPGALPVLSVVGEEGDLHALRLPRRRASR